MKKWHRVISYLIVILVGVMASFLVLSFLLPGEEGLLEHGQKVEKKNAKTEVSMVSLGDSLTEGIGDETNQGGYVPIVASDLKSYFSINVTTKNFGKSGDRSDQILKRLKENKEQQEALKKADFVVLTVGANDLMKTVRKELFNELSIATFKAPGNEYKTHLLNLFTEIRKYAPDLPIYVFGIYNPFYVYFTQITELQEIVNYWNELSEETVKSQKKCYFVPINDLLSNGSDATKSNPSSNVSSSDSSKETEKNGETLPSSEESSGIKKNKNQSSTEKKITGSSSDDTTSSEEVSGNDLIFAEDNFHPNILGYQKMATALKEKLIQTQGLWLKEVRSDE